MSHIVWTFEGPQHNAPWLRLTRPRDAVRPVQARRQPSARRKVAFAVISTFALWALVGATALPFIL